MKKYPDFDLRMERSDYNDFNNFYSKLENKKDIFYMYFTAGLLHWVKKSLSFVPESVNVVLIGAGLGEEEKEWICENYEYPYHNFNKWYSDHYVWEVLFLINEYSFGWIDIDCFIFNPDYFKKITQIDKQTGINTLFSYKDVEFGNHISDTFFLFINIDVLHTIWEQIQVSPVASKPDQPDDGSLGLLKVIQEDENEIIKKVMSSDENGYALTPKWNNTMTRLKFYDSTIVYQLTLIALGYEIKNINEFCNEKQSKQAMHIGASSYYRIIDTNKPAFLKQYRMTAIINGLIHQQFVNSLPKEYKLRGRLIRNDFIKTGLNEEERKEFLYRMRDDLNIEHQAFERLINE